ncbi:MAG: hypothetical protein KKH95_09735, partial [Gammaproteobacteria bacterium]|nr:hypothetical protein [Gammaproteobacteria bacterium]
HFRVFDHSARIPEIRYLKNNQILADDVSTAIEIKGSHFSDGELKAQIDNYNVPVTVLDDETVLIPAGSLQMLDLDYGEHHLKLSNHERSALYMGAVMYTAAPVYTEFQLDVNSGDITGGHHITVSASKPVFQPGSRARFVSRLTGQVIETTISENDYELINLDDDVIHLNQMRFRAPGVVYPGIYDVYAVMPAGAATREVLLGQFSYSRGLGHQWNLPNYPPMQVGGAELQEQNLLIGVKDGVDATATNRFLMKYGFEFYDVTIPDRPVRLSQVRLSAPVYGVTMADNQAYLAGDTAGLHLIDITDKENPLLVATEAFSGLKVMDVAIRRSQQVLAIAITDPLGGGFIRFMDLLDEDRLTPVGYQTLTFADADNDPHILQGQPIDISWNEGKLYVLHRAERKLLLTVISNLGDGAPVWVTNELEEVSGNRELHEYSILVESGLVYLGAPDAQYIYELDAQDKASISYWQQRDAGGELFAQEGRILTSTEEGFVVVRPHRLAVRSVTPLAGTSVSVGSEIRIQFNSLLDTSAESIGAAISLVAQDGSVIPPEQYRLEAINTVRGAQVSVHLEQMLPEGEFRLRVSDILKDLDGIGMARAVEHPLYFSAAHAPDIKSVQRWVNGAPAGHYFHADGSEVARVQGQFFTSGMSVYVGDTLLDGASVRVLSATELELDIPDLFKGELAISVNLRAQNEHGEGILMGAIVVMPRGRLEAFYPLIGPPQGGNRIDLYGTGFNRFMNVYFGDNQAGNLRLISANH